MKINTLEFSAVEECEIRVQAALKLINQGKSQEEAKEITENLSSQNLVRLALGFEPRSRGGARKYTSNRWCSECKRQEKKVEAWKEGLCESCWHQSADAKSAMI